jgi:3alpha(or 20beta)-hydroxysteroid dehydrogenase
MQRFEDQTAIITGAANDMGAAQAVGFAAEGARVVVADVLEEECGWLARELGERGLSRSSM